MKRSGTPIIVACCLALVSGVWFCAVSSAADRDLAAVLSADHVTRTVLDNGLTLLVKPDRRVPLVSIVVLVGTGSALEGPYAGSGISHLLEHMLFKGTADRPAARCIPQVRSVPQQVARGGLPGRSAWHGQGKLVTGVQDEHE